MRKQRLLMKNMKYVAVGLVFTALMSLSTRASAEPKHIPGQPVDVTVEERPSGKSDILKEKKYTLVKDLAFSEAFTTKVTNLKGVTDENVRVTSEDISVLQKFMTKTEKLRLTLQACSDHSDEMFANLMDKFMGFMASQFADVEKEELKKDKHVDAKYMATFIWSAEAYLNKQASKFSLSEKDQKWNKEFLADMKSAYKALHKEEYSLKSWADDRRAAILTPGADLIDKELAQTIPDTDAAVAALDKSENACLVKVAPKPEAKPEVKPEPKPEAKPEVKPEPKPEAKPEKVALNPAPTLGGNENKTPTPNTPPANPPLVNPNANQAVQPNPVANSGVDNGLAGLENDINDELRQKEDELRRLKDELQDQLAAVDQLKRDRNAFVNDDKNNLGALLDALGKNNENQPFIPPQPAAAPLASNDDGGEDDNQVQPPPAAEPQDPNQGQQPYTPPAAPPVQQVVGASDKNDSSKSSWFDDLMKSKSDLPVINEQQIAMKTLQDLVSANKDLNEQRMMQQQMGQNGMGGNTVAGAMGMGNNRAVGQNRPMMTGGARNGQQRKMGVNPLARGSDTAIPSSLKARSGSIR